MTRMRAVTWEGRPYHVCVENYPKPRIRDPLDIIVRITTSAICGTDLHIYHGMLGSAHVPWIMGHEAVGIVQEVAEGVKTFRRGDRVVVGATISCGHCENCSEGNFQNCLVVNPPKEGGLFGFGDDFGPPHIGGLQAEYIRVPFADATCLLIPPGTENELDYLMMADIWPAAWGGLEHSGFKAGDSVAVFGAGPVGLLCAYSAILQGARVVYSIDHVTARLHQAERFGAVPINFTTTDPVKEILKLEPRGVRRSIDCVGMECLNADLEPQQNIVLTQCINVTESNGGVGVVGAYSPISSRSDGVPDPLLGNFELPFGEAWYKGLQIKGGVVDIRPSLFLMRDLIQTGKARPGMVVSSEIGIEDVPDAYHCFDHKLETKIVIRCDALQLKPSQCF